MTGRRHFLASAGLSLIPAWLTAQQPVAAPTDTLTRPLADPLRDQYSVGRLRDSMTAADSDPVIIAIERRLRCTCGCTLDVYTCRTTDFTCTYSPALHDEVMKRYSGGATPKEIIAAFVSREGESILMAPPAEGFNLIGYVVPGLVMTAGALGLLAWITRRRMAVSGAGVSPQGAVAGVPPASAPPPDDAQRERLRRALDDVES